MDIGKEQEVVTVDPIETPVPGKEVAPVPEPSPEPVPEKEKVPA